MANTRSARKRIRANEKKFERNRATKSAVRTQVAKARHALLEGEGVDVEATLKAAVRELDRAAEKGVLHRNNARRRKSRLTAMASKIMRLAEGGTDAAAARTKAAGGEKGKTSKPAKATKKTAAKAPAKVAAAKKPAAAKAAPKTTAEKS